MRAFVFLASIAVASSGRVEFSLIDSGPRDKVIGLIKPHAGNALKAAAKSAKPSAVGSVLKAAAKNAKPPVAGKPQGLPKMFQAPVPVPKGHSNAPRLNLPKVKPPNTVVGAILNSGMPPAPAGESPGLPQSLSDATLSNVPLAEAGPKGSGIVKIAGVDIQFGTDAAVAAIESMDWVPSKEEAGKILKKLECWPDHQPPCANPREALDWISEYKGSYKYAGNVARATRGAEVLMHEQAPADIFNTKFSVEQGTAAAFEYGLALSAALSLVEAPSTKQTLFRGTKQPVGLVDKLQGLAGGKGTFAFPAVTSTSGSQKHATSFMGRPGAENAGDVRVFYEFQTDQAKSVRTAMGPDAVYGEELESILPPSQHFEVESVEHLRGGRMGDHYRVVLKDPYLNAMD